MNRFQKLIDFARAMQPASRQLRSFHVSFILRKTRLIAIACNCKKTHPTNLRNPMQDECGKNIPTKFTCSELAVFNKAKRKTNVDFSRCTLVNVRLKNDGSVGDSQPCQSCQSLLRHANFRKVFHTGDVEGEFIEWIS